MSRALLVICVATTWWTTQAFDAWARVAIELPAGEYAITDPFRYDPATPYASEQNRGADVVAAGGVARALTDGYVAFVGSVAGRRVVTVRSKIDDIAAIVTYTGLLRSDLRAGEQVVRGDAIGSALALHVGAYVVGARHRYLPVIAGDAVVLRRNDGAVPSLARRRSPVADTIARRLHEAIDGRAALSAPVAHRAIARALPRVDRSLPMPSSGRAGVRRRNAAVASIGLIEAIEVLGSVTQRLQTAPRAVASSSHSPRIDAARGAGRQRRAPRQTGRFDPSLDPAGSTALRGASHHAITSASNVRGPTIERSGSVSSAPVPIPERERSSTGIRRPRGPVPRAQPPVVRAVAQRSRSGRFSSLGGTAGRGGDAATGAEAPRVERLDEPWTRRRSGTALVLIGALLAALLLARRRRVTRGPGPVVHRWQPRWPVPPRAVLRRRPPRERSTQRVRLGDSDGSGSSRRVTIHRPREPA